MKIPCLTRVTDAMRDDKVTNYIIYLTGDTET